MSETTYPVTICWPTGPKRYPSAAQNLLNPTWKAALARAHRHELITCQCPGHGERRLVVRYYRSTDTYYLAGYPNAGHEHSPDCRYFKSDPSLSGQAGYAAGVITTRDDGRLAIRLERGLIAKQPGHAATVNPAPPRQANGGHKRPAMTLLGLLHLLWQESRLNLWRPQNGGRTVRTVHHALRRAARGICSGRLTVDDVLLVASDESSKENVAGNIRRFNEAKETSRRLLVLAPLAAYTPERATSKRLPIAHFHGIPSIWINEDLWHNANRRFASAMRAWQHGSRVICFVQADAPREDARGLRALDLVLMPINAQWIPYDSSHELALADKLVAERRSFEKPLRYDASEDEVFPDFLLLDTERGQPMPLEVFGMDTPNYVRRKQAKMTHYDTKYGRGGWWSWNAWTAPDRIPDLPGPRSHTGAVEA